MTIFYTPPPHTTADTDDQYARLEVFRAEHPDWDISYDRETRSWHAFKLMPHGTEDIYRTLLVYLLDELDKKVSK